MYPFHIAKAAATLHFTPLYSGALRYAFTPSVGSPHFGECGLKSGARYYRALSVHACSSQAHFPPHYSVHPFHIDNRTTANCGFWLEYASKTPLEVVADLPRRMRLFWLRCQIMRLRSIHIKPHYSQNAFDSALLAWYERGISQTWLQIAIGVTDFQTLKRGSAQTTHAQESSGRELCGLSIIGCKATHATGNRLGYAKVKTRSS